MVRCTTYCETKVYTGITIWSPEATHIVMPLSFPVILVALKKSSDALDTKEVVSLSEVFLPKSLRKNSSYQRFFLTTQAVDA